MATLDAEFHRRSQRLNTIASRPTDAVGDAFELGVGDRVRLEAFVDAGLEDIQHRTGRVRRELHDRCVFESIGGVGDEPGCVAVVVAADTEHRDRVDAVEVCQQRRRLERVELVDDAARTGAVVHYPTEAAR